VGKIVLAATTYANLIKTKRLLPVLPIVLAAMARANQPREKLLPTAVKTAMFAVTQVVPTVSTEEHIFAPRIVAR